MGPKVVVGVADVVVTAVELVGACAMSGETRVKRVTRRT